METKSAFSLATLFSAVLIGTMPVNAAEIRSNMNGMCLDVPGANFRQGTPLQMYPCNRSAAQNFTQTSAGELRIGGLCVDALSARGNNGDRIALWQCNGGGNQRWVSANSRLIGINKRCMDIGNRNPMPGAAVILWDCNGGSNQSWNGIPNNLASDGSGVNPGIAQKMGTDISGLKAAAALTTVAPLQAVAPLTTVAP